MCLEIFRQASAAVRRVLGCLCLLIIGGPVMIIVGIVVLVTPNNRADNLAAYNNAVDAFDPFSADFASWSTGSIGGNAVSLTTNSPITINDASSDIKPGYSTFAYATKTTASISGAQSYAIDTIAPFSRTPQLTRSATRSILCTSSDCDYQCGGDDGQCTFSRMSSICSNDYGGSYSGGNCDVSSSCGSCTYTLYLKDFYSVVTHSSDPTYVFEQSATLQSALYSFSAISQSYQTSSAPVSVRFLVYNDSDPLIVLERVTKGTRDFGITAEQQRRIGTGLLAAGIVLTVIVALTCFGIYKCVISRQSAPPPQEPSLMVPPPRQQEPMYYPQPAPAGGSVYGYGQQPPPPQAPVYGYGQPPPPAAPAYGYGQPPPPAPAYGYGQPPPPTAAAPYGYGQPPPPPPTYGQPPPQRPL